MQQAALWPQAGYLLSAGVGAIALLLASRIGGTCWPTIAPVLPAAFLAGGRAQAIATVGLTPLTLVFFQQVSLVGLFANLVAIPLVTLVITPLALPGVLLSPLAAWTVQGLVAWLAWLAS